MRVLRTSSGKQAVTEITEARLELIKRVVAEIGLAGTPTYTEVVVTSSCFYPVYVVVAAIYS